MRRAKRSGNFVSPPTHEVRRFCIAQPFDAASRQIAQIGLFTGDRGRRRSNPRHPAGKEALGCRAGIRAEAPSVGSRGPGGSDASGCGAPVLPGRATRDDLVRASYRKPPQPSVVAASPSRTRGIESAGRTLWRWPPPKVAASGGEHQRERKRHGGSAQRPGSAGVAPMASGAAMVQRLDREVRSPPLTIVVPAGR